MIAETHTIKLLDHGYIKYIEHWGSGESSVGEAAIIEAARMSTRKGFNGWEQDEKLLSFLYNNKHMTPFEMAGATIEVAAPIFVFREWHRHRTQSYNEMSGRYVPLPNENYMPEFYNVLERAHMAINTSNKQAGAVAAHILERHELANWLVRLQSDYSRTQATYEQGLEIGIPKELARLPVPVARYSRMRASANLRNWMQFLTLRMDPKAQWEIRQYAMSACAIFTELFPRTMRLFNG